MVGQANKEVSEWCK